MATRRALARYLVTRGLVLVLLELTVIRFAWTFNVDYSAFVLAGVIWMLGWCMVLMAALVRLPARVVGAIGLAVIFLQQIFQAAAAGSAAVSSRCHRLDLGVRLPGGVRALGRPSASFTCWFHGSA